MISSREIEVLMETFGLYVLLGAVAWAISFAIARTFTPLHRHWWRLGILTGLLVVIALVRPPVTMRPMVLRDPYFAECAGTAKGFFTLSAWWTGTLASAIVVTFRNRKKSQNKRMCRLQIDQRPI